MNTEHGPNNNFGMLNHFYDRLLRSLIDLEFINSRRADVLFLE